jgi:S-adenosylmethionine:tRNA ribosyltransferase-isomerase
MPAAPMRLSQFTYDLPADRIAQTPAPARTDSRLLVIPRNGDVSHRRFPAVLDRLRPGDVLVRNVTRVIPARLIGTRAAGGRAELLLLHPLAGPAVRWQALAKPGRALKAGARLHFGPLTAAVDEKHADGSVAVSFDCPPADFDRLLDEHGRMPLPPYIRRKDHEDPARLADDRARYQTVYAREAGAVAAPTAGLHFSEALLAAIARQGVTIADLTLHVGAGTFLPIRAENLDEHTMHGEWFALPAETASAVETARAQGGRVIAVGTTTARVLETVGATPGPLKATSGETRLFIKPGHEWRVVDVLLTNFHLPKSTLLVLVCALAGTDRLLAAYREAVAAGYRFFSYGDACWIERA